MEDVLDLYQRPYDPDYPVVNMDEQPLQLIGEKVTPLPLQPGQPKKVDYEYVRHGTAVAFLFNEALANWRHVHVQETRTAIDWAEQVRILLEDHYPNANKVLLICDQLNTHAISSLYKAFSPEKARALARRLEIHHTPKHGSWLNIAEIELSAMTKQCLNRRIDSIEIIKTETTAWVNHRNASEIGVDWRFTSSDARIKLKRLYPKF